MMLRDLGLLALAWIGAAVIAYLVYDWRQENDIDDLRDRLGEVEDDLGFGGEDVVFEPASATGGGLRVTIVSTSDDDESIPGIMEVKGSAVVEIENLGRPDPVTGPGLEIIGTTGDGGACNVFKDLTGFADPQPGQHDELTLKWDCEDMALLTIEGLNFAATD